jgi:hypothetical protein
MAVWTILDYVGPKGECPFFEWQSGLPLDAQAHIDVRLLQMVGLLKWPEKWISKYKTTEKIYELRIPFKKIQYRPLGVYAPGRKFILVEGTVEKGDKIPASALARARKRQKLLAEEPHHVREHRYN